MGRRFALNVFVMLAVAAIAGSALAQGDFPTKPIQWVVAYPAGSPADTTSRLLAQYAEPYLPNNGRFVIVNKPGAAGVIGMTDVYNAKPDGYTIGTSAMAALAIKPALGATTFTPDGFQPIIKYVDAQQLLFVRWDSPFKTAQDLIDYAREHPGEVTYGTSGALNAVHIGIETFGQAAGIQLEAVPYNGEPEAINALLRGDTVAAGINGANSYQYFESQQLRPLFNYTAVREPFTDVPTLKELGYDVEVSFFNGVLAPKGVPQDRVTILLDAFDKALNDPELKKTFADRSLVSNPLELDDFQQLIDDLYATNTKVMKAVGIIQ